MNTQTAIAGDSVDYQYSNQDAKDKRRKAELGQVFEASVNEEIAAKVRAVRERLSKKVSERQENVEEG